MSENQEFEVGCVVIPKGDSDILCSGAEWYDHAVVASVEPFVLVSERGDMVWKSTVEKSEFNITGMAETHEIANILKRIERDVYAKVVIGPDNKALLEGMIPAPKI